MKKLFERKVIYISKQLVEVDTTQSKFFPFLSSSLIASNAQQQITIKGIHAMCNWENVKQYIPHQKEFQEFVFFGRSNVGKSSLINSLIRKEFVETSKKPGKTKELAFLQVKFPYETLLVDAPGYGYASDASKQEIMQWGRLIDYYLKNTPKNDKQLIFLLVDTLHGLKETDGMLLKMLKRYSKQFMLVYTKSDRASEQNIRQSVEIAKKLQETFSDMMFYVHYTSARTGEGIPELRNHIMYRMATKVYMEQPDQHQKK